MDAVHGDALVAAITAAPDDDAPRMVYADWLSERGDALGELIALQCRLANNATEPDVVAREHELRASLAPRWLAPLQAILPGGYELRRGFVERAELFVTHEVLAARLDELLARAPLLRSIGLPGIAAHPMPPAIARLDALALHELGANGTDETTFEVLTSPHLARLRRLEVTNGRLGARAVAAMCEHPAPLDHLRLDASFPYPSPVDYQDGDQAVAWLAAAPARAVLRSLVLAGFRVSSLQPLAALPRLHTVVLHDCQVSGELPLGLPASVHVTRDPPAPTSRPTYAAMFTEALPAGFIQAIVEYRQLTDTGLAEAKTAVERIARRRA
jgi:uncharacterized protein (TIGR02996 family)